LLAPSAVQGDSAPAALVEALQSLILDGRSDVIVVARGGGSSSDLAAFNDEALLRAAFASPIPIVSAIGHETDWCLLDLVADLRAPTPSAAAELMTPSIESERAAFVDAIDGHISRFERNLSTLIMDVDRMTTRIDRIGPAATLPATRSQLEADRGQLQTVAIQILQNLGNRCSSQRARLHANYALATQGRIVRIGRAGDLLQALSPAKTMARGYASVEHRDTGRPVKTAGDVVAGEVLRSRFLDGSIDSTVYTVKLVTH
jgi:exodeoxyribonuclease VII large subunit